MIQNINRVNMTCNVASDVTLDLTRSDRPLAFFTVGINDTWTDRKGEAAHKVTFVECFVLGNFANMISKNLEKGMLIALEGRLRDISGKVKVEVNSITFCERKESK